MSRAELNRILSERWTELPESVRTPQQLAGVGGVACGATHGVMEKCNFACTSCYLSDIANQTEPLPFDVVKEQLDALRRHLGPGGKAQITSGEVTLLDRHELGRIIAYALEIGLDPMVMTNGQVLLEDPTYLETLVCDYGLAKVSFHIDTTQKGRRGMKLHDGLRERDIHGIREQCAELIRSTRRRTGKTLHATHTITITERNVGDIEDVVRWTLDNVDAFRLLSFLPAAEVGRTADRRTDALGLDAVWQRICAGVGRPLDRDAMHFGHRDCNITVPALVVSIDGVSRVVEVVREGHPADRAVFSEALRTLSVRVDLDDGVVRNGIRAGFGLLSRPRLALRLAWIGAGRLWALRRVPWAVLRGRKVRVRPMLLVVHRFMDAEELATPLGQERLEACVFKLPVGGRMVSMCEMNATELRRQTNMGQLQERFARRAASG